MLPNEAIYMANEPTYTSRVRVPSEVAEKFTEAPGMGGRQSYMRWMHGLLMKSNTLHLADSDVRRIIQYSRGNGGVQDASRKVLEAWHKENAANDDISQRLRLEVKAAIRPGVGRKTDYALRHYKAIGAVIAGAGSHIDERGRKWLAAQLAALFARDSRDFDEEKWLETCGLLDKEK